MRRSTSRRSSATPVGSALRSCMSSHAKRDVAGSARADLADFWRFFQRLLHGSIAEQIWSGLG
eukprot:8827199-Prorocentrum_lima.AAC.1